jgi:fatty acid desaturase
MYPVSDATVQPQVTPEITRRQPEEAGETWAHSTQVRRTLKDAVPAAWFQSSDAYGWSVTLRVLVPLILVLALCPYVYALFSPWSFFLLVPLVGTALYKLQFVLHDCAHKSLFETKLRNEQVGTVCGWLAGANFPVYRHIHWRHHRFNGQAVDPQLPDYLDDRPVSAAEYGWFLLSPLVGGRILGYLRREMGSLFGVKSAVAPTMKAAEKVPRIGRGWVATVIATQVAIATLATGGWRYPVLALVYPLGAAFIALFLSRLRTIAEHHQTFEDKVDDFSRSHRPAILDRVFLYDANFNYHFEHHIFPHMPSNRLGEFSRQFGVEFHGPNTMGGSMFGTIVRFMSKPR